MIEDALAGKIDLIVTKSISRFARNTIDTLTTVRQLKEKGIEVFFEKENIYTLDSKGELLITIMSSIAQEESRSISENVTWGQRKRFADGSEAKIVRKIYRLFLEGLTPTHIARTLTEEGIPTPGGKVIWQNSTVESILTNEKYKGDALLQKKYTVDFLSKKQKINEGEIPQYYVEGSHEGIVTAEVFDLVQYELHRRKSLNTSYCSKSPFSSRLICGECGGTYGAKIWDSNNKYRREIYQCNHRHGRHSCDGLGCKTPHLTADEIKGAFIGAFNSCIKNRREIINNCITAISEILDTSKLEKQASNLSEECVVVTELIRKCVDENAHISVDPKVYAEKYEQLADRYAKAKDKLDKTETEIANRNSRKNMIAAFLDELEKQEHLITDFDTGLWNAVIESMTIYSKEHIVFKFKGGTEIKWSIV